mmetsp:Transcript_21469/g.53585  ORF Transcript_21469/g.53585 Transcript_21469/m.53585 type:complete len:395 (+) Transcript_21469:42-1226(+)
MLWGKKGGAQQTTQSNSVDMHSRFKIDHTKRFGEGGYGATFAAYDTATNEEIVVKVIDTRKMKMENILKECKFLEICKGHENVIEIKAHGLGQNKHSHLYFIYMERASGGELFDQLTTFNGPIPEHVVRGFISQLAAGIAHCHRCCVAHRDIKLENALLSDTGVVKLIDFGLSHLYERDPDTGVADRRVPIHGYCGSKSYAAPEVLAGRGYDGFLADVWSLGVSMFGLLNGFFPVDEAKNTDWRFQKLCRAQELNKSSTATIMGWYKKSPDHLSAEARDLIDAMLNINPVKRPSIEQVLNHPFITGKDPSKDQFSQNSVYDNDPTVANIYRGAAIQHANFVMDDVEIMEDGPVYRSMGGTDDDLGDDFETGAMPGLTRQVAFGGADSVKDLFLP